MMAASILSRKRAHVLFSCSLYNSANTITIVNAEMPRWGAWACLCSFQQCPVRRSPMDLSLDYWGARTRSTRSQRCLKVSFALNDSCETVHRPVERYTVFRRLQFPSTASLFTISHYFLKDVRGFLQMSS